MDIEKHRHHRARRPRQDHARRQDAPAGRRVPRQSGRRRARDGLEPARARARASPSWPRTPPSAGRARRSTSSTRRATPTSAARSSASCAWWTACCSSSTRSTGPMPQTRFVLAQGARARAARRSSSSTRSTGPAPIRCACTTRCSTCSSSSRPTQEQLDAPVLYASARDGTSTMRARRQPLGDLTPLVRDHPRPRPAAARAIASGPFQMLDLDASTSRPISAASRIGRIERGTVRVGDNGRAAAAGRAELEPTDVEQSAGHQALHLRRPRSRRGGGGGRRRDRRARRARGRRDRADRHRRRAPGAARGHRGRGADDLGGLHRQQLARSPGGKGSSSPAAQVRERLYRSSSGTSRCGSRTPTRTDTLDRLGARRAAPRHPDGDDAARGLRVPGLAAAGHHARRARTASGSSRTRS